jgi:Fe-S-cluster containining protein
VTLKRVNTKRTQKSPEILKRELSKVDCLTCSVCCRGPKKPHRIAVLDIDPLNEKLYEAAESRFPERIERVSDSAFIVRGEDCCAFLEEDNSCSVYSIRPLVCAIFPFIVQSGVKEFKDGSRVEIPQLLLTSACPPLRKAKEQGVAYVALDDIVTTVSIGGREECRPKDSILGMSFDNVLFCISRLGIFNHDSLIKVKGEIIFPIW